MRRSISLRTIVPGIALALACASVVCGQSTPASPGADAPPVMRIVDDADEVHLEMAINRLEPKSGDGPRIYLVGAVHIADKSFYDTLQGFLDTKDLVLYEGVLPAGAGSETHETEPLNDERRAAITKMRIELMGHAVRRHASKVGSLPADLDELEESMDERWKPLSGSLRSDAWGRPLAYRTLDDSATFDIVSLGSDNSDGGEGTAADVHWTSLPAAKPSPDGDDDSGIQQQMADAFGLVFQLDAMNHAGANWKNSDLSLDQVQIRMADAGADAGSLFRMLQGSGFQAGLAKILFRFIAMSDVMQTGAKLMMVEMLSHADQLIGAMPGGMGAIMEVILKDRNTVVLRDVAEAVRTGEAREIAIIYGAGHMPDLSRRIMDDLNYRHAETSWNTAITVDLASLGEARKQVEGMRKMMSASIERQIKAMNARNAKSSVDPANSEPPPHSD